MIEYNLDDSYVIQFDEFNGFYNIVDARKRNKPVVIRDISNFAEALEALEELTKEFVCEFTYDVVDNDRTVLGQQRKTVVAKSVVEAKKKLKAEIHKINPKYEIVNLTTVSVK